MFEKPEEWLPEPEPREVAEFIAYELLGTCVPSVISLIEMLDLYGYPQSCLEEKYICEVVDSITFNCEVCNWWCEAGDYAENTEEEICSDCGDNV